METHPFFPALPDGWRLNGPLTTTLHSLVMDASVLTHGLHAENVCLPLVSCKPSEVKNGSSALMLGAALVLTAPLLPEAEADALQNCAQQLRFHPENFRRSRPALADAKLQDVPGLIVRDGNGQRAYFAASPDQLAPLCPLIWQEQPRSMTQEDLSNLPRDNMQIGFATADVHDGQLNEAIYLGSVCLGPAPNTPVLDAISRLHEDGLDVHAIALDEIRSDQALLISPTDGPGLRLIPPSANDPYLYEAVQSVTQFVQHQQEQQHRRKQHRRVSLIATLVFFTMVLLFLILTAAVAPRDCVLMLLTLCLCSAAVLILSGAARRKWLAAAALLAGVAGAAMALSPLLTAFAAAAGFLHGILIRVLLRRNS